MMNPCSRAAGFSLVELMVSLALGLLILAGMLDAFNSNSATGTTNVRYAEVQTNGRYAIDFMRRELQHAGFLGLQSIGSPGLDATTIRKNGSTGSITSDGCDTAGFVTKIEWPIWGANNANALTCTGMNYLTGSGDVLVLRRAGLQKLTGAPVANTLYVRSELSRATVYLGSAQPAVAVRPGETYTPEDYPLRTDVYYISPYTNSSSESPNIPALYRLRLGADSTIAMTPELIATGIENIQVQYGIRAAGGGMSYVNAASVANTDWPNVVAVKIWLLARSTDAEYSGFINKTAYTLGDQTYNPGGLSGGSVIGDHFVRQPFTLVVQLRK